MSFSNKISSFFVLQTHEKSNKAKVVYRLVADWLRPKAVEIDAQFAFAFIKYLMQAASITHR